MMQLFKNLRIAGALVLATSSFGALAADVPATVPDTLLGSYDLTFASESSEAPFTTGTRVTMVVMPGNQLCVAGRLLTDPVIRNGNPHEAIWTDGPTQIEAALSSLVAGFNEVNLSKGVLGTSSFVFLGQLRGSKVNSSTTCTSAPPVPELTISDAAQSMFELAAQVYPTLLVNGSALGLYQGYIYRFFADSGIYVGLKDDIVFTMGGPFGNEIKPQGSVTVVTQKLQNALDNANQPNPNPPITDGLYNLKITGFVQAGGINVAVPDTNIVGVPAPRPSERGVFEETIKTGFGVDTIANYKITVINDTANRVTYRVEFSTSAGVGMVYDLTYDYTK